MDVAATDLPLHFGVSMALFKRRTDRKRFAACLAAAFVETFAALTGTCSFSAGHCMGLRNRHPKIAYPGPTVFSP